ncbi:rho GTPase-activating protein 19 isoform X2 [Coregonus clupeaformis]|uniref:rho GTPase-activating protein 19 isoform X2 n=1 Tax=Coregonus clupeaformis TaxID=59861 RepID=UPI001E1C5F27|nr:rho GTPase-activating protein 19 isoform X2 [Coregonus clupeaformis]
MFYNRPIRDGVGGVRDTSGGFKRKMAADKETNENTQNRRGTVCNVVISQNAGGSWGGGGVGGRPPIIFNPDFFVEKLRHERPEVFQELVLSNITRLIDLPGAEFSLLLGDEGGPKTPTGAGGGFFRSFNFLKRKDKEVVFGTPLTEGGIAQIYQLIEYLSKNLQVEGLFRVPGNSVRQQALKEQLNSGADIDLEAGGFHPNDVATVLKTFLGELPEPLLTHQHFNVHLKIADMTLFDEKGNKTSVPDKERQIEAFQLLFLLLPQANRSLLKLILDLLYHTAKQQDKNKMSAFNLALMFAPHVVWPRNMVASDLQENLKKLNYGMAFLIKHSQKLFRAPVYMREHARMLFTGSKSLQTKDDIDLLPVTGSPAPVPLPLKRCWADPSQYLSPSQYPSSSSSSSSQGQQHHTEESLKELFRHVYDNMPNSAKKKKLLLQLAKQTTPGPAPPGTPIYNYQTPPAQSKKHPRSRSFGGFIKRRHKGDQLALERRGRHISPEMVAAATGRQGKENVVLQSDSPSISRMCFSPSLETSM